MKEASFFHSSLIIPHSSFSSESRALEDLPHRGLVPRLRDEVSDDAVADLAQHRADRDAARQHDAEAPRVRARDLAQERRAADLRHELVADDHVEGVLGERAPGLFERRRGPHLMLRRERLAEDAEARRLVVEIKYRKSLVVAHVFDPRRAAGAAPRAVARQAVYRSPSGAAGFRGFAGPGGTCGAKAARGHRTCPRAVGATRR